MTLTERLREKISQAFYNHGLLCASYPIPIILFTGLCILACWYVFSLPYVVEECGETLNLMQWRLGCCVFLCSGDLIRMLTGAA